MPDITDAENIVIALNAVAVAAGNLEDRANRMGASVYRKLEAALGEDPAAELHRIAVILQDAAAS